MKRLIFRVVAVWTFAIAAAGAVSPPASAQMPGGFATFSKGEAVIRSANGDHKFRIEIARTEQQHEQGLMYRRHLDADAGMLFVYRRPTESDMWMKNTLLPLDMIFVRAGGKIGRIAERTIPMSEKVIYSGGRVIAVLEVNAGTVSRLGIKVGDTLVSSALDDGDD